MLGNLDTAQTRPLDFDASFQQPLQLWIVGKDPDNLTIVEHYFVGAFQIFEDAFESLVLHLLW